MQAVDDIGIAIADVYAKSVLALTGKANAHGTLLEEYGGLVAYINSNKAFEEFLCTSTIDVEKRRTTLEKAFRGKMSDLLLDFLQVLNRKERLALVEQIYTQCKLACQAHLNQVEVTAVSATALSGATREKLLAALKKYTGKDPILSEKVNAVLIGGLVVLIGDEKIDFSVSRRLRGYREVFLNRASQEIYGGREYFQ